MFFKALAAFVCRFWAGIIAFWLIAAAALAFLAPPLGDVTSSSRSGYLPSQSDSIQAKKLLDYFFPSDSFSSRIVLAVEKQSPLEDGDIQWLHDTAEAFGRDNPTGNVTKVLTPLSTPFLRSKLVSKDGKAAMAVLYLSTEFVAKDTKRLVGRVLKTVKNPPAGVTFAPTGDAVVGYDYHHAMGSSASRTTWATILLLAAILLFIFRSPITPAISLVSIGISFWIAKSLIALCAVAGASVYPMVESFLVVLVFGAGTDYCVFLIFRYYEELKSGRTEKEAMTATLDTVGHAISSSAFTVIIGVGSLIFAQFGPFSQTGPYIALGVFMALCAGLTLTPALILALHKILFWPTGSLHHELEPPAWQKVIGFVTRKPLAVFVAVTLALSPFLYFGFKAQRSFDFLRELDDHTSSRRGMEILKSHFRPGDMSPLVLVLKTRTKLDTPAGLDRIYQLTRALSKRKEVQEVRSAVWPTGDPKLLQEGMLGNQVRKMNDGLDRMLEGMEKMHEGIGKILAKLEQSGAQNPDAQAANVRDELDKAIAGVEGFEQDLQKKSEGLLAGLSGGQYEKAAAKLETLRLGLIRLRDGLTGQTTRLKEALTELSDGTAQSIEGLRKMAKATKSWTDPGSAAYGAMNHLVLPEDILERQPKLKEAFDYYIAPSGTATRLTLVLRAQPFSDQEKNDILALRSFVKTKTEEIFSGSCRFHFAGTGSTILDQRIITDRDFYRIMSYVMIGIFLVLLLLLRDWLAPFYLIGTMIFSYFVSLGVTSLVFEHVMGQIGLDWKVSFFMFILLVALGEDYNIFLMARIKEERQKLGLVDGVRVATVRTGPLITFCGLIMAGTFLSLMLSPLEVLLQLGFGVTVGVLVDTFIVRPLLVPSLVLLVSRITEGK